MLLSEIYTCDKPTPDLAKNRVSKLTLCATAQGDVQYHLRGGGGKNND